MFCSFLWAVYSLWTKYTALMARIIYVRPSSQGKSYLCAEIDRQVFPTSLCQIIEFLVFDLQEGLVREKLKAPKIFFDDTKVRWRENAHIFHAQTFFNLVLRLIRSFPPGLKLFLQASIHLITDMIILLMPRWIIWLENMSWEIWGFVKWASPLREAVICNMGGVSNLGSSNSYIFRGLSRYTRAPKLCRHHDWRITFI